MGFLPVKTEHGCTFSICSQSSTPVQVHQLFPAYFNCPVLPLSPAFCSITLPGPFRGRCRAFWCLPEMQGLKRSRIGNRSKEAVLGHLGETNPTLLASLTSGGSHSCGGPLVTRMASPFLVPSPAASLHLLFSCPFRREVAGSPLSASFAGGAFGSDLAPFRQHLAGSPLLCAVVGLGLGLITLPGPLGGWWLCACCASCYRTPTP